MNRAKGARLMGAGSQGRRRGRRLAVGIAALAVVGLGGGAWWQFSATPPGKLDAARSAYREGRYRDALTLANERLREVADDRDALRLSARASARLGRDAAAVAGFTRLGGGDAGSEDLYLLSQTLLRQSRPAEAERFLRDAVRQEPPSAEALDALAILDTQADRLVEAGRLAERLTKVPGWEARGFARLGLVREKEADHESAVRALKEAVALGGVPSEASLAPGTLRKHLARNLLYLGKSAEAEAVLTVPKPADDAEAAWLLSRVALQRGDRAAVVAATARAAEAAAAAGVPVTTAGNAATEPSPYVGSARCAECHKEEYDQQQSSRHSRTFHRASELAALELPAARQQDVKYPTVEVAFRPEESGAPLQAKVGSDTYRAVLTYVLGSGRHAATPVVRDETGTLREFRLTHYHPFGWDLTPGQRTRPDQARDYLGEPQDADTLRRCVGCHTTNYLAGLAPDPQQAGPEARDRGIGCERCHGPGANHVAAAQLKLPDLAVARYRPGPGGGRPHAMALCGSCHGTQGRAMPQDSPAATLRFQGTTLPWSRCYAESRGALDCITCHSAHRDVEQSASFYEAKCLGCHDGKTDTADAGAPRRPACPVSPAKGCVGCHMPRVPSIVPHATFTDHHIRVRRDEPRTASTP